MKQLNFLNRAWAGIMLVLFMGAIMVAMALAIIVMTGEWDIDRLMEHDLELLRSIGMADPILNKISRMTRADRAEIVPDPPLKPKTKPGDLITLGEHRLVCGDATNKGDLWVLMNNERADMAFVDPPYNVNYEGAGKNTKTKIKGDNQTESAFREFLEKSFAELAECTKEGAALYTCYASRTHREFEDSLNKKGWEVRNQIIWIKTVASMGWGNYRWKHEPIFYCHKRGEAVEFHGDRTNYTEWREELDDDALLRKMKEIMEKDETEGQTSVWRVKREVNYVHPTQKPVQLVKIAVANSSRPGDLVLDTFGGSGSTLMACELIDRRCYTMELDPKYCDVIVERWEKFTGKKAIR